MNNVTQMQNGLTAGQNAVVPNLKHKDDLVKLRNTILDQLASSYSYPKAWFEDRLLLDDADEFACFRFINARKTPFLVGCVAPSYETAERHLKNLILETETAFLGIAFNGEQLRFLRRRYDGRFDYVSDIESHSGFSLTKPLRAPSNCESKRDLEPLTERVENVFFEAHSHIRDIDGLHPDEALDELCKVLYAKLFDEESTHPEERYTLQRWAYGTTEEFSSSVRAIYHEANEYDTRVFALKIPGYERSRGVFNTPIRLSSPALAKVVETLQEYDITRTPDDIKGRAFQKVLAPIVRAGMGQYLTPDPVVSFMVHSMRPDASELILDPFCGSAHFLTSALDYVKARNSKSLSGKAFHEFLFGKLHGIEKSDRMVRVAMTDMRLHGDGHSNVRCTDALLDLKNYPDLQPESFDLILTNPPFGSILGPEAISQLGTFELAEGKKTVPLEILGLERCFQFLRPGGRLGIVLPEGVLANRVTAYVRDWVAKQARILGVISLPLDTFYPFGASIKTSILFARKWRKGEAKGADYPIFLGRVDCVGYDMSGRPKGENELPAVADSFVNFLIEQGE